jgi:protein TonB
LKRARSLILPRPSNGRRERAGSIGIAVVLHVLAALMILSLKSPPEARPGAPGWAFALDEGEAGGGGGGERTHLLQLPEPPADVPALPLLVPTTEPLVPEVVLPDLVDPTMLALMAPPDSFPVPSGAGGGSGAGAGPGSGTGSGGGSGSGVGPGTGSGRGAGRGGDGVRPPAPLTILIPPAATAAVRGKGATVRLQVDSGGVVRDADVVVSSGDRGYDEKLRRIAMGWRFRPARDAANRPVPYPFEVSLRF